MKLPAWVYGLLTLAWTAFVTYNYYCVKCGCCGAKPVPTINLGKLDYRWNSAEAVTGEAFGAYKTYILTAGGSGDTLVITGLYRANEKNTTTYSDLGIARAESAKQLFLDKVPADRIICTSKLVEDDMNQKDLHPSADFEWRKMVVNTAEASIIETGNQASINFPTGSASRTANEKVDNYLAALCSKHAGSSAKFIITGHTDNQGKPDFNMQLADKRAKAIRDVLVKCGISKSRITTASKGQTEPIADNATEEGRYQNRRVVIETQE